MVPTPDRPTYRSRTVCMSIIIFHCYAYSNLNFIVLEQWLSVGMLTAWGHILKMQEKAMAPHSSTLAWQIPWMEEPGRLQSVGSLGIGHDWTTSLWLFTFMHWRRKWQPTPVFLPGESQGWGAWWAAAYGVAQSQTRLKQLSSSSSSIASIELSSLPLGLMVMVMTSRI